MKYFISVICLAIFFYTSSAQIKTAKKTATTAIKPAFKNLMDSFSYSIGYNIANNLKGQGIARLNLDVVKKAMNDAFQKKSSPLNTEAMNNTMQKQMVVFLAQNSQPEIAKGRAFLANNKKRKEITTLPSGLQYEVLVKSDSGTVHPNGNDTVVVNYIGTLIDGTEFENSYKYGTPATFFVNRVIQGWAEALQLMTVGDKWKIYVPTEIAYYLFPNDPKQIPPGAALIFEIKLEAIKPAQQQ